MELVEVDSVGATVFEFFLKELIQRIAMVKGPEIVGVGNRPERNLRPLADSPFGTQSRTLGEHPARPTGRLVGRLVRKPHRRLPHHGNN